MQRRAAAISVAFFLVLSAGAYVTLTAADAPSVQVENPEYTLSANETLAPGDVTYTVASLSEGSATLQYTNESYRFTDSLANASQIQYQNATYTVVVPNASDPTEFTLRENQTVDEPTVTQNGTEYVVVEDNGTKTLVPRDEYLPDPQTHTFAEGDDFAYQNHTWTVGNVTQSTVPLSRIDTNTINVSLSEGGTVTLGGTEYVAHFADGSLLLSSDLQAYQAELDNQTYFKERTNGLWGVTILSALAAIVLIMFAFLPSRY